MSDHPLITDRFLATLANHPEAIAVDAPPSERRPRRRRFSYRELACDSFGISETLGSIPKAEEAVIALLVERGHPRLYASCLGILFAGSAHFCLDSNQPEARLRAMIEDARPAALIVDAANAERARGLVDCPILVLEELRPAAEATPPVNPPRDPSALAYLIATSGTSGRPKAVELEHRGIANLVASDLEVFDLGPEDRVAQGSSPAYDSSLEECWMAFASGATVVVLDDVTARLGPDLPDWLRREAITVLCPPPTLLRSMDVDDPARELPALRLLYVGGEALPRDVAASWGRGRRLVNGYGPTECTVTVLRAEIVDPERIPIGKPIDGHRAWILDQALEPVEDGVAGELCIAGPGLARGYRAADPTGGGRFLDHPRFGRIYRSGDRARRDASRDFHYLGRLDDQVKLRGHRIELEDVDAALPALTGVREGAAVILGERLVAGVVLESTDAAFDEEALKRALRERLSEVMLPARLTRLDALPRNTSDKLDRRALRDLLREAEAIVVAESGDPVEDAIARAFAEALGGDPGPPEADFFLDLGGDSLAAALAISQLRKNEATASLAVRDLYEVRNREALGLRAREAVPEDATTSRRRERPPSGTLTGAHPTFCLLAQAGVLLVSLLVGAAVLRLLSFQLFPWLLRTLDVPLFLIASPLLAFVGLVLYTALALPLALAAKRLLIGRYRARRTPVESGLALRAWIVERFVRALPWGFVAGTPLVVVGLRLLGAKIGRRVHIHRGVDLLRGGWDLLEIGDDVTLGQDSALRLVRLVDRQLLFAPVRIEDGVVLETRAAVEGGAIVEREACLSALSILGESDRAEAGMRYEGVPAKAVAPAPRRDANEIGPELSPLRYTLAHLGLRALCSAALAAPTLLLLFGAWAWFRPSGDEVVAWLFSADLSAAVIVPLALLGIVAGLLGLPAQAFLVRALDRIEPGTTFSRWSTRFARLWMVSGTVEAAGRTLSGTLFWPLWLRLAGMKVGKRCEISTITDVIPSTVRIGPESFFADGIYLGGPQIRRGVATLSPLSLERDSFLGNHVVIEGGQRLPERLLLGVCTVADQERMKPGTSWFGHPAFELPRREIVEADRRLTHDPGPLRYFTRLFWESARFLLPAIPLLFALSWFKIGHALIRSSAVEEAIPLLAATTLFHLAALCALVLLAKWTLLGRVRPGQHPLWSCWCSRWDFVYVLWNAWARPLLSPLEGSRLLHPWIRAMGTHIGARVVLGSGFAQLVDPDMIHIEDEATVDVLYQAHSFEDRVLKIDRVRIEKGATVEAGTVLLYGCTIGAGARVHGNSVVMKRETLLPEQAWQGCPTRPRN